MYKNSSLKLEKGIITGININCLINWLKIYSM